MEKKWKIFCLVATSIFMSTLDSSIVNVALPYIMNDLGTHFEMIQWVVLGYLLTVSSFLLTFGRLSDIMGRRTVYVAGFTIFTVGSLTCALSGSPLTLVMSRVVQGMGAAMLMACSPALIVDVFSEQERGKALGLVGAVVAAGLTVGPMTGGLILQYFSWRFIFYINLPIGISAAILGMKLLSAPATDTGCSEPMDVKGSAVLVVFLSSLIIFITQMPQRGIWSNFSLGAAVICLISMVGFAAIERRARYPLFDPALLMIRLFIYPAAASAILFASLFVIIFLMPFLLTYPFGFTASKTGMIMVVPFLALLVFSPLAGALYDRYRSRGMCLIGMGFVAGSLFSLAWLQPDKSIIDILWRLLLAGLGTAFFVSPNNTATMSSVPLNRRGIASGTVATARNMGMVIGVAFAGLVFTTSFSKLSGGASLDVYESSMQPYFMASFKRAMTAGGCLALVGMAVTWMRGAER